MDLELELVTVQLLLECLFSLLLLLRSSQLWRERRKMLSTPANHPGLDRPGRLWTVLRKVLSTHAPCPLPQVHLPTARARQVLLAVV